MPDETQPGPTGMTTEQADAVLTVAAIAAVAPQIEAALVKKLLGLAMPV